MRIAIYTAALGLAAGVVAEPSLKLTLHGPGTINDIENLVIKANLTNTGSETVKLLRDPRSLLGRWRTNAFQFAGASGSPNFTGVKVNYSPWLALQHDHESNFVVLASGQSIELIHDLAGVYNFTRSGAGEYTLSANNMFEYVDGSGNLATIAAEARPLNLRITGKLASIKGTPNHQPGKLARRTIGYVGCSSARQSQIAAAANAANAYVAESSSYLSQISSGTPRFMTWFGTFTSSRYTVVKSVYARIGMDATSTTYDCTCTDASTYAYVYPDSPGYIYLCGAFWLSPNTGSDSRAGTIIHEQSHFTVNGGTNDYVYGQAGTKSLAISSPATAIINGGSYQYFAENTPPLP